jgi:hypothetical protein
MAAVLTEFWAAWRLLNWLNTVISTTPITNQIARFLNKLFNAIP